MYFIHVSFFIQKEEDLVRIWMKFCKFVRKLEGDNVCILIIIET